MFCGDEVATIRFCIGFTSADVVWVGNNSLGCCGNVLAAGATRLAVVETARGIASLPNTMGCTIFGFTFNKKKAKSDNVVNGSSCSFIAEMFDT